MGVLAPAKSKGSKQDTHPGAAGAVSAVNAFTHAAKEHLEQIADSTKTITAQVQALFSSAEIPAFGFLRAVWLIVTSSGGSGAGTAAVMKADAPWNVLAGVTIKDSNGQPIFGPLGGYECYLVHLLGGYLEYPDPTKPTGFSAPDVGGNFTFAVRIPIEVSARDGLGALANMNSSATYKVDCSIADTGSVFATNPAPTLPNIRVQAYAEEWTEPEAVAADGVANAQEPPALGTVQEWSAQDINTNAGNQTPKLTRLGNSIRMWVLIARDGTGARVDTVLPDPLTIQWDSRQLAVVPKALLKVYNYARYGFTLPVGVYVYDFAHDLDNGVGAELRNQWLPTTTGTRLELQGANWGAGTLRVLTCDVLAFIGDVNAG